MPTVSASAIVPASADEAFAFIQDFRNIPRLQPHFQTVKLLTEEHTGVGATVMLHGHFHGVPMNARNRIIAYSPPLRLVSISEGAVLSRSTWELEPLLTDPPTTRVTLIIDYKLKNLLGGVFTGPGKALWPLFNLEVQGMTDESLRQLHNIFAEERLA